MGLGGKPVVLCRQSLDRKWSNPRLLVSSDCWHHLVPCPVQALELCHTWAFLASQDQLFPFRTLCVIIHEILDIFSLQNTIPWFWLKFSWVKEGYSSSNAPRARKLGNGLGILLLVNCVSRTTVTSVPCTLNTCFDVHTIWLFTLYLPLALARVGFQVSLKYSWDFYVSHIGVVRNNSFHLPRQLQHLPECPSNLQIS